MRATTLHRQTKQDQEKVWVKGRAGYRARVMPGQGKGRAGQGWAALEQGKGRAQRWQTVKRVSTVVTGLTVGIQN